MIIAALTFMFFVKAILTFFSLLGIIALFVGRILPYLLGIKPSKDTDFYAEYEEEPIQNIVAVVVHQLETPSGILELTINVNNDVLERKVNGQKVFMNHPMKFLPEKRQFIINPNTQQAIIVPIERKENSEY